MIFIISQKVLSKSVIPSVTSNLRLTLGKISSFCRKVDRQQALCVISSWDHCQRFSLSQICNMPRIEFETVQNLSSGFVEWGSEVMATTTLLHNHYTLFHEYNLKRDDYVEKKTLYYVPFNKDFIGKTKVFTVGLSLEL